MLKVKAYSVSPIKREKTLRLFLSIEIVFDFYIHFRAYWAHARGCALLLDYDAAVKHGRQAFSLATEVICKHTRTISYTHAHKATYAHTPLTHTPHAFLN